jgi:hypothetical protein
MHYVIVSVQAGRPEATRSWRLRDDRSAFDEEPMVVTVGAGAALPQAKRA